MHRALHDMSTLCICVCVYKFYDIGFRLHNWYEHIHTFTHVRTLQYVPTVLLLLHANALPYTTAP